ncbi:MAG: hypothetical protein JMM75_00875 [Candidatus Xiphinematobacter sp.]|nr:MAG: hypothetical protein JMM75_00875 [Candidatus Xiphinematobacter sp.]
MINRLEFRRLGDDSPSVPLFLLYTLPCHPAYTFNWTTAVILLLIILTMYPSAVSSRSNLGNGCCSAVVQGSTEIACAREVIFREGASMAEFFGQVIVRDPQFKLYCDHLILTLRKDHQGIQHAEAIGNVVVIQENAHPHRQAVRSVGRAGRVHYNPLTGSLLLTEWPQLWQGASGHIATGKKTRMTLNKSGHSNTVGQNKTVIVEELQGS